MTLDPSGKIAPGEPTSNPAPEPHRASRFKKGARPVDGAHEGRAELEAACSRRREGPPDRHVPVGGPDFGLHRGAGAAAINPEIGNPARGPGLRR